MITTITATQVLANDFTYMQVPSGTDKEDQVGKTMDIIALLQAIFAIQLVSGKTLHEQSLLIARLSKMSQLCLLYHLLPETLLSPSSPCCCQSQIRRCHDMTTPMVNKVSRMEVAAHARFAWIKRTFTARCFVSEMVVAASALVGQAAYQGLVPGAKDK